MSETPAFTQFAPGFEFLQNLMKGANSAIPGMGQWVAPTLNPEEIEKRISELRTVQFWLEQNTRMIAATIQALEVQRMTLATLKTMNVQMGDLRESLSIHPHSAADAAPASAAPAASAHTSAPAPAAGAAPLVDPVKWWGALTEQFTHLAANAMKEVAPHAPGAAAGKTAAAKPRKPASKAASKTAAPRAQASAPSSTKPRSASAKRRST
jgi:hypothetical protein